MSSIDQETPQEQTNGSEFIPRVYGLAGIYANIVGGVLMAESVAGSNKLELIGGVGSIALGSLSTFRAVHLARLAGTEQATEISVEKQ